MQLTINQKELQWKSSVDEGEDQALEISQDNFQKC